MKQNEYIWQQVAGIDVTGMQSSQIFPEMSTFHVELEQKLHNLEEAKQTQTIEMEEFKQWMEKEKKTLEWEKSQLLIRQEKYQKERIAIAEEQQKLSQDRSDIEAQLFALEQQTKALTNEKEQLKVEKQNLEKKNQDLTGIIFLPLELNCFSPVRKITKWLYRLVIIFLKNF